MAAAAAAAAAAVAAAAVAAGAVRRQRVAFVVEFVVIAGTAISSDLLKKVKEFLPDNGGGHGGYDL